jgi:L-malate glycosyltransferase
MRNSYSIFVPHCSGLLTDHLPNGDGLIAHGFITQLARRGHRLHVAAQRLKLREPLHPNVAVYEIASRSSGNFAKRMEYMLRVRRLLRTLQKDYCFDLIHQLNPVCTGISLSLIGSGLPLVLGTYVARWPDDPAPGVVGSLMQGAFARGRDVISALQQWQADTLVLTTPAAENCLPNPDGVRDRVYFLPHGVDTELFCPEVEQGSTDQTLEDPRHPSILFFANVVKRKGIFTLINAFPAVASEFPEARLRIVGDGPDLPEARQRVAALSCAHQVEFLGRQEHVDAPAFYRNCTVYCLPSFGEPYGGTLVEAMSCGKAVVVTDSGGPPYIVSKEGGRCVPAGDSASLGTALIELLRDPARCAAMGRRNRRVVEATMSWDHVTERLENIYEITLSTGRQKGNRSKNLTAVSGAVSRVMHTSS